MSAFPPPNLLHNFNDLLRKNRFFVLALYFLSKFILMRSANEGCSSFGASAIATVALVVVLVVVLLVDVLGCVDSDDADDVVVIDDDCCCCCCSVK